MKKAMATWIVFMTGALPCACTLLTSLDGFDSESGNHLELDATPSRTDGQISNRDGDGDGDANTNADAPDPDVLLSNAQVLTTTEGTPRSLAIDKNYVYWHNTAGNRGLMRVDRTLRGDDGGAPKLLRNGGDTWTSGVVVTESKIAIGEHSNYLIMLYQKSGESAGFITSPSQLIRPNQLKSYGGTVFAFDSKGMFSGSDQGGSGFSLIQSISINHMSVDSSNVYFIDSTHLMRMSKAGADAGLDTVAEVGGGIRGLAVDGSHLYWINDVGQVVSIDKTALAGTPKVLASGQAGPSSIALDSTGIFWTNSASGTVMRMPKTGGPPNVVATDQPGASLLVADDFGAVWLRDGSEVVALSRQ